MVARLLAPALVFLVLPIPVSAQATGTIRGIVRLKAKSTAIHDAAVSIIELDRRTTTSADGAFEFSDVPPGTYELLAHVHAFTDDRQRVTLQPGETAEVNFALTVAPYREQITVTASGREESTLEAFQSVIAIDSLEL